MSSTQKSPIDAYRDTRNEILTMITMSKGLCKNDIEGVGINYDEYKKAIEFLNTGIKEFSNLAGEENNTDYITKRHAELKQLKENSGINKDHEKNQSMLQKIAGSKTIEDKLCKSFGKTQKKDIISKEIITCFKQIKSDNDPSGLICEDNAVSTDATVTATATATNPTGGKKRRSKRRKNSKKRSRKSNRKSRRH